MTDLTYILNAIEQTATHLKHIPRLGWKFTFRGREYFFYEPGAGTHLLRFSIPCLHRTAPEERACALDAVNETNLNVRYVRALLLSSGCITLQYDFLDPGDVKAVENVVAKHILPALDYAACFLIKKIEVGLLAQSASCPVPQLF